MEITDIENENWAQIIEWLKSNRSLNNVNVHFSEIQKLLQILMRCTTKFLWYNCLEAPVLEALTEALKVLRLCVTNKEVAHWLLENQNFYAVSSELMESLFTKKNGPELCTKYLLHVFLNLLGSQDQLSQRQLSELQFLNSKFLPLFFGAYGHIYETSALLYNFVSRNLVNIDDVNLIACVLRYHTDEHKDNEYIDFLIEKIISNEFVWNNFEAIPLQPRLELLNCLKELLMAPNSHNLVIQVKELPDACLKCLVAFFNSCANIVFQVTQQDNTVAVQEVSCILEILAHQSSNEKWLPQLQEDKNILINAGVLLVNIHRLGQTSNNVFSPVQKLSEIQNPSDMMRRSPVFGFKADLVRLIGNLCWKNRRNQDLAREAEIIPVLLDSCNIDAKNPFIIQWVILAIRNIFENNRENQAVIAGLTKQGVVSSEVLQEFGLTLHAEEDLSIGIVSLDINK